jgi:hypothetical protein
MKIKTVLILLTIIGAAPISGQSIDAMKVATETVALKEIEFSYKDIERAIADVANDAHYQLLNECAEWVKNNKEPKELFQRILLQRLDELVGYRDSILSNYAGPIASLCLMSCIATLFYMRKQRFAMKINPVIQADVPTLSNKIDIGNEYMKLCFLYGGAALVLWPMALYGKTMQQSYIKIQGDLQIERLNNLLSCIENI